MRIMPYSLQGRFLVGLVIIMLIMGGFFAAVLRMHMKQLFISEARAKANLMVDNTEAVEQYMRLELRPAASRMVADDGFIIEAMSSSYVLRHLLNTVTLKDNNFTYRRVAKDARNPAYEVNEEEEALLERFKENHALQRIENTVMVDGEERLVVARPEYFTPDCMRCHIDPADAPKLLVDMYGDKRGFWRASGDLAGLSIISVPIVSSSGAIAHSTGIFALWFLSGMVMLLLVVQVFFHQLVVHNLRRVGSIIHRTFFHEGDKSLREEGEKLLAPLQREEEIEGMVRSIESVATHLRDARAQLSNYAKNLESMVKDRTAELETVVGERSADVQLFVNLLSRLNRGQGKGELLEASLRLIARHFGADRAVFAAQASGQGDMVWTAEGKAVPVRPGENEEMLRYAEEPHPVQLPGRWYIPVRTAGKSQGLLGLFWEHGPDGDAALPKRTSEHGSEELSLAAAFGGQLGIALENLDSLDALLRQNSLLDSIVEGISDPLILTEGAGMPVLGNSSARALAARLLHREREPGDGSRVSAPEAGSAEAGVASGGAEAALADLLTLLGVEQAALREARPLQREVLLPEGGSFVVSLYPLQPGHAGGGRVVAHIRDTTHEKRMLAHLRQNEKLAAVGQLAAGLAHEINNPLGVIRCYTDLLSASATGEQNRADIEIILRHVDQAQSVLRDLLDFARPHPSSSGPCDAGALLASLLDVFRVRAKADNVELRLEVDSRLSELAVDCGMLEQVVVNLLLNAFDALQGERAAGRGSILLRADLNPERDEAVISVIDNGPGIDARHMAQIFDPFFTTKEPGAGTGLGLAVAFGMVRDMGGRLEAATLHPDAPERRGSLFTITLPAAPRTGIEPEDAATRATGDSHAPA